MKNIIKNLLKKVFKVCEKKSQDATALMLDKIFVNCPICNVPSQNHEYAYLCSGEFHKTLVFRITNLLNNSKFKDAIELIIDNPWNPNNDGLDLFAVKCKNISNDDVLLLLVINPFSFDQNLSLIKTFKVSYLQFMAIVDSYNININFKVLN